uniref:Uncharacterized protein n=1 Tax=Romanomermis culicivorax TaxID=13658 RepID=A0A915HG69_ROMCU
MAESHFIGRDMDGGGNAKGPAQSVFAWEAAAAANKKEKTTTANGRTFAARKAAPVAKLGAYVTYGDEGGAPHKELVSASPTQSSPVGYVMMETKRGAAASPPASSIFPTAKKKSVMKKRSKTADYISLAPKKPSILPSIFKRKAPSIKSKQSKKSKSKMARSTAAKTRTGVAANGFTSPSVVSAVKQSEVLWPTKMKKPISESMGYKIIKSTIKNMLLQPTPTNVNLIAAEYFSLKTFRTATSRDDILCLLIKLVNECGWKANHRQDRYVALY